MDNHIEVPLVVSCFIRGHTLKTSRVRDLSAGNDQPSTARCHPQPLALSDWFPIFVPAGKEQCLQQMCVPMNVYLYLFICTHEMEILRDDRCRCSSRLTLQLQRAVDYHCAVCHVISSINEGRN